MGPQITLNTTFFGQDLNAEIAQIQSDFFIIYRLLVTLFLRVSALIAKELSLPIPLSRIDYNDFYNILRSLLWPDYGINRDSIFFMGFNNN